MSGHAKYADYGKDIVCSAASSIAITTVNAILKINDKAISFSNDDDLVINILSNDDITKKLINNMIDLLEELESQYNKNIKIIK
jgi:uncharacterized protein YsxB (DUF464 family)